MQLLCVGIGLVLMILFIVQLNKAKQYDELLENLDENTFPLKDLYGVGLTWGSKKPFIISEKLAAQLQTQAATLYEPQYAQYYATIVWAQALTYGHLFLTITFLAAGLMKDICIMVLGAGIFITVIAVSYALQKMDEDMKKNTEECDAELPEVVSTMAVLVNSGMVLKEAWNVVADSGQGTFHRMMRKAAENMRNGYSATDAILLFGRDSNSPEVKKFTSALTQSMEKGGAELASFLAHQSSELWNAKRQRMLQAGEKAASKLLMPIMLIFFGVIIIVITAAFAGALF